MWEVVDSLEPNYYQILGIKDPNGMSDLKKIMKKINLEHHPDKQTGDSKTDYVEMRKIFQILRKPELKNAYDKFGSIKCMNCSIFKDYFYVHLMHFSAFYISSAVALIIFAVIGKGSFARFWRFFALIILANFELFLVTRDYDFIGLFFQPFVFLPHFTVSQKIILLRESTIIIFMALSQFGPLYFESEKNIDQTISDLDEISKLHAKESQKMFKSAFDPFKNNEESLELLKKKMGKLSVELKLFELDPEYRKKYLSQIPK